MGEAGGARDWKGIITAAAKSEAPALGYTGTYAFANVLLTVAGSVILVL